MYQPKHNTSIIMIIVDPMMSGLSVHGKENGVFCPTVFGRMILVGNENDSITQNNTYILNDIFVESYGTL